MQRRICSTASASLSVFPSLPGGRGTLRGPSLRRFSGAAPAGPRTWHVLGVQQIALGAGKKDDLTAFWGGLMGLSKVGTYRSEKENVDEDIYVLGSGVHAVEVDLMQPINPTASPKVHVPPLNHIGLWVDNIHGAVADLEAKGVRFAPGGVRQGAAGHLVTFIHPKSAVGVLVELVQAPANVVQAFKERNDKGAP